MVFASPRASSIIENGTFSQVLIGPNILHQLCRFTHSVNIMVYVSVSFRSFLVGSMNSRTSLLGSEELDRLFPDRKMKVYVCTWNMCELKVNFE